MKTVLFMIREFKNFVVIVLGVALLGVFCIYGKGIVSIVIDTFATKTVIIPEHKIESHKVSLAQDVVIGRNDKNGFSLPHISLQNILHQDIEKNSLVFNTLPPGHWVIIPSLGVKAPIVDVVYADHEKLQKGDFSDELKGGVVRYPYTAIPGRTGTGNSVIFGHSSVELRDQEKYGYVFQKLPKVNIGEQITVIWDGNLFTYEIDHKVVKRPKDVSMELASWNDKSYLTLMACYPLFSDAQRILIRGKLVQVPSDSFALQRKDDYSKFPGNLQPSKLQNG